MTVMNTKNHWQNVSIEPPAKIVYILKFGEIMKPEEYSSQAKSRYRVGGNYEI